MGSGTTPSAGDKERFILTNSEELNFQIKYNRSRLRICRSWVINFFLIAVASAVWAYTWKPSALVLLPLLSLFLASISFLAWFKLSKDYYTNIQASYTYLIEDKLKSPHE
jgi:hypothetical protein